MHKQLERQARKFLRLKHCVHMYNIYLRMSVHTTLASSLCPQLWFPGPLCGHEKRSVSLPMHRKLSSQI